MQGSVRRSDIHTLAAAAKKGKTKAPASEIISARAHPIILFYLLPVTLSDLPK